MKSKQSVNIKAAASMLATSMNATMGLPSRQEANSLGKEYLTI